MNRIKRASLEHHSVGQLKMLVTTVYIYLLRESTVRFSRLFFSIRKFPYEDVLTKEIESWKGFADRLPTEVDRKVFMEMFNNCYAKAINAKGRPFPTEPVIMALLFTA